MTAFYRDYRVRGSERIYAGRVISLRRDLVRMPTGTDAVREVVEHPGAVAVVALDEDGRLTLVRQYRHPVGRDLWEVPAGILDVPGEAPARAAARELAEEAALEAARWEVLADVLTSPGMTDEAVRVFLARGLSDVPPVEGHDEEADLAVDRVPVGEAVHRVFDGEIENGPTCVAILAAHAWLSAPERFPLRPADAPWPARSAQ